ncbi:MAG: hypothetical protein ACRETS_06130, partial [Steroidobacteraceae bacterium]
MSTAERPPIAPVPAMAEAPAAPAPVLAPATTVRGAVTALPGRTSTLVRVQGLATRLVPQLQYQLARLGLAGHAGLAALIAALVVAMSVVAPARHSLEALSADLARAQHPSEAALANEAVPHLLASLPTRAQMPAVLAQVFGQAREAGVSLDTGHYVYTPARSGTIGRYDLEFPVKAAYPDIRNFINHTLTAVPAAALSKLHVERKTVGDPV